MDTKREFIYERFKRDIQGMDNLKDVQETACKFLRLYLAQQDIVDELINKGWLPKGTATGID
ncbi:MAG: hypothetical protein VXB01_06700 [Opitutae bacterium]|jgi:hypothetical protein